MRRGSPSRSKDSDEGSSFESFLEAWLVRQKGWLEELVSMKQQGVETHSDEDLKNLINRVMMHFQLYYEEKSRMAERKVYVLFAPTWLTSFERTFLWIAGFKPALAFHVLRSSVYDLRVEQDDGILKLQVETRLEERKLDNELAKIQESVGAPPLMESLKLEEAEAEAEGLRSLKAALESLVASADLLRTSTVVKLVQMLNPVQNVRFLTAIVQIQLHIRNWGLQMESRPPL